MFRNGMWVVDEEGRVGICWLNGDERAVRLVDSNPNDPLNDHLSAEPWHDGWRQAVHTEIPAHRQPTVEVAKRLGYAVPVR